MDPSQASFDTFGRWMVTRLKADMAQDPTSQAAPLARFFTGLYEDMLANPGAFFIPTEPFVPFFAHVLLTPEETAQHEALKAARMRVRKAVFATLEFLYHLGNAGAPADGNLQLPRAVFDRLVADGAKKARSRHFLTALERTGLSFSAGVPVIVSSSTDPGMPAELANFSKACARVKDFDFYLFRRCDLAVYDGKTAPTFADALHLAPPPFQNEVAETDERLSQLRFKREIF